MALIEITGLEKKYGDHYALRGINLKVERGEIFVLLGPTGAGMTTLLRLLNLLMESSLDARHVTALRYGGGHLMSSRNR